MALPLLVAYGLWILWACWWTWHDLEMLAAHPKSVALLVALRECGYGSGDLMILRCDGKTLREIMESIGEPDRWTALWLMRGSYAGSIFGPPMWSVSKAGTGVVACYLCMIVWRFARWLQSCRFPEAWRATCHLHWPLSRGVENQKS